ncbi:MAG: CHAT domain-containing protein [Acidimicrobiales bacterium]
MGDDLRPKASAVGDLATEALNLAEPDPHRAIALAQLVEAWPDQDDVGLQVLALAKWAKGRANRHLGLRREAEVALEEAVGLFASAGDQPGLARALIALAQERIDAGRFDEAISVLYEAENDLAGADKALVAAQRALALQRAGRVMDAREDFDRAIDAFESAGMEVEAAVVKQNRALVHAYRGELDEADEDLDAAAKVFARRAQPIRNAEVLHNQGFVAARRGDLPRALDLFDQAQRRAAELGALRPEMLVDRVEVCLQAGLSQEGRALAEAAVGVLEDAGFTADVPEACLLAARGCERDGDPSAAREWALRAVGLFGDQQRPRWGTLARYAVLRAEAAGGSPARDLADRLVPTAAELRRAGWADPAVEAEVLAVDLLVAAGKLDAAREILDRLAPGVARMLPLNRLAVRLCQSRWLLAADDAQGANRAVVSGLRALLAYQATLGSIELRAAAGGRAGEVMAMGVALARAAGRPARALWWMETVHAAQQVEPGCRVDDPEMDASLASLRDVMTLLSREPANVKETTVLRRRQSVLEEVVRRRSRHAVGLRAFGRRTFSVDAISEDLGDKLLVEYAPVGDHLVAVVLYRGECRLVELASLPEVRHAVASLRLALQAALATSPSRVALEALGAAGTAVQGLVLAPLVLPRTDEVVVVADGPVASTPWALLPDLAGTTLVVATSAEAALRPPKHPPPSELRVLTLAGPDLRYAEEEAEAVSAIWRGSARLLKGAQADVTAAKAAMRTADVVHVAAHGVFRGDNPLLSSIRMSDGPITGDELAQATRAARLVVLSCCNSGMADASGIGLSRLLTGAGATAVVASVSPVSDAGSVELMTALHSELVQGANPARALTTARHTVRGPLRSPSSAGFACFGNGFESVLAR